MPEAHELLSDPREIRKALDKARYGYSLTPGVGSYLFSPAPSLIGNCMTAAR